jgi:hypothetical protein
MSVPLPRDDHDHDPQLKGFVDPLGVHPPSPVDALNHVAPPLELHGP